MESVPAGFAVPLKVEVNPYSRLKAGALRSGCAAKRRPPPRLRLAKGGKPLRPAISPLPSGEGQWERALGARVPLFHHGQAKLRDSLSG